MPAQQGQVGSYYRVITVETARSGCNVQRCIIGRCEELTQAGGRSLTSLLSQRLSVGTTVNGCLPEIPAACRHSEESAVDGVSQSVGPRPLPLPPLDNSRHALPTRTLARSHQVPPSLPDHRRPSVHSVRRLRTQRPVTPDATERSKDRGGAASPMHSAAINQPAVRRSNRH